MSSNPQQYLHGHAKHVSLGVFDLQLRTIDRSLAQSSQCPLWLIRDRNMPAKGSAMPPESGSRIGIFASGAMDLCRLMVRPCTLASSKKERRMMRYELTDYEWAAI